VALVLAVVVVLSPSLLSAQDETPPKADLFIGYQWLNPGGTVPVGSNPPFQPPPPPVATKLPSMPIGYGVTGTYNFDKWWGLSSVQPGPGLESTISVGPRLMGGDNINMFTHLLDWIVSVPRTCRQRHWRRTGQRHRPENLKSLSFRHIEADYVLVSTTFPICASDEPSSPSGARRRRLRGLVFNFGGSGKERLWQVLRSRP
jgi:hypothetical protein